MGWKSGSKYRDGPQALEGCWDGDLEIDVCDRTEFDMCKKNLIYLFVRYYAPIGVKIKKGGMR